VNPFALVSLACKRNINFNNMFHALASGGEFAFWCDEFKPGNALRPDKGREVMAIYWTVDTLPSWFQRRKWGLFFFGAYPTSRLEITPGGLGQLITKMLRVFFNFPSFDFAVGVRFESPNGMSFKIVIKRVSAFVFDLKAFAQALGWNGSGSSHCCPICRNCLKEHGEKCLSLEGTENLTYYQGKLKDYVQHKGEDLWRIADHLEAVVPTFTSKKQVRDLEQICGYKCEPHGLLADRFSRRFVDPVDVIYFDVHHCWTASGGVAQYHVNEFVRYILESHANASLEMLDHFASNITYPKNFPKPRRNFFSQYWCSEQRSCFRGFAQDTLAAIQVLVLFVETLLAPDPSNPHIEAFLLLSAILGSYELGDRLIGSPTLDQLDHWHDRYVDLYRSLGYKETPKLHTARHIVDRIRRARKYLNTLPGERFHRYVKAFSNFSFNNYELAVCRRMVLAFLDGVKDEDFAVPSYLVRPVAFPPDLADWALCNFGLVSPRCSLTAVMPNGSFSLGDMVLCDNDVVAEVRLIVGGVVRGGVQSIVIKVMAELWAAGASNNGVYFATGKAYHMDGDAISRTLAFAPRQGGRQVRLPTCR
jgi:hypothetical protein